MINIVEYKPVYQPYFEQLNRSWFNKHFGMEIEPIDEFVLTQPEKAILDPGGTILLALLEEKVAGTVALRRAANQTYEFTKMAVQEEQRGKGLGRALGKAAIRKARSLGATRIILYSHSSLQPAIHLYKDLGFKEIPLEQGTYSHLRCDIKMELLLDVLSIQKANPTHAPDIARIGRASFSDSFSRFFNIQEDLWNYLDYTYATEKIEASILRPNNIYFLATIDQLPVGFAKLKRQSNKKGLLGNKQTELQKIYLSKEYQGFGVGGGLLREVFQSVREWGPDCIWLDVLVGNDKAFQLYKKNGFSKEGEHFFIIGSQTFKFDVMALYPEHKSAEPENNQESFLQH